MTNWTILDNETVHRNCELTAKAVAGKHRGIIEYEDLLQEAYILCATNADKVSDYITQDSGGYLNRWLWLKLTTVATGYANKRRKDVSLEALAAHWDDE